MTKAFAGRNGNVAMWAIKPAPTSNRQWQWRPASSMCRDNPNDLQLVAVIWPMAIDGNAVTNDNINDEGGVNRLIEGVTIVTL